ncbi:MAG: division/cell wall cluster transcriptional repressor MraZ [Candidatus Binataceae bacterium]
MFSGRFDHSIDDKGRVSLPATIRDLIQREGQDKVYITNQLKDGENSCLDLFVPRDWQAVLAKLGEMPRTRLLERFEMLYVGGAHEVPVDKQGRVLIPQRLRDFASLSKDITFQGRRDRFEVWDRGKLEHLIGEIAEELKDPAIREKIGFY